MGSHSYQLLVITILGLTLLSTGQARMLDHLTLEDQPTRRKLTSLGGYTIGYTEGYKKYCTDKGIKESDLFLDEVEGKKKSQDLEGYYKGTREISRPIVVSRELKDPGKTGADFAKAMIYPGIITSLIFTLSFLFVPLCFLYCCFSN